MNLTKISRLMLGALCLLQSVSAQADVTRPSLHVENQAYFSVAVPNAWYVRESTQGIEALAPDGLTAVRVEMAVDAFGITSPLGLIQFHLLKWRGKDAHVQNVELLPNQPGPNGVAWQSASVDVAMIENGSQMFARIVASVAQSSSVYQAIIKVIKAPEQQWADVQKWLPAIADSVALKSDTRYVNEVLWAIPATFPDQAIVEEYDAVWESVGLPPERLEQILQNDNKGYVKLTDAALRETYWLPLESFDAARQAFRHPKTLARWLKLP